MSKNKKSPELDLKEVIHKLLKASNDNKPCLTKDEVKQLCQTATVIFARQPMLLQLDSPVKICGDIHGQYNDLLNIFEQVGSPDDTSFLFLGDYVDRGRNSVDTMCLLLAYKIKHSKSFYLLRGNHQSDQCNKIYGFYDQCKSKYDIDIWKAFGNAFRWMPVAAVVGSKIFCCHGGLSPQLTKVDQINQIQRPTQVPDEGLLCDLLWSDPSDQTKGWIKNPKRLISYMFGQEAVQNFLEQNGFDMVCRAHQVFQQGYKFHFNRRLVTIFSAPDYNSYQNKGVVLSVDSELKCQIQHIAPANHKQSKRGKHRK